MSAFRRKLDGEYFIAPSDLNISQEVWTKFERRPDLEHVANLLREKDHSNLPLQKSKVGNVWKIEVSGEYPDFDIKTSTPSTHSDTLVIHNFKLHESSNELLEWFIKTLS